MGLIKIYSTCAEHFYDSSTVFVANLTLYLRVMPSMMKFKAISLKCSVINQRANLPVKACCCLSARKCKAIFSGSAKHQETCLIQFMLWVKVITSFGIGSASKTINNALQVAFHS